MFLFVVGRLYVPRNSPRLIVHRTTLTSVFTTRCVLSMDSLFRERNTTISRVCGVASRVQCVTLLHRFQSMILPRSLSRLSLIGCRSVDSLPIGRTVSVRRGGLCPPWRCQDLTPPPPMEHEGTAALGHQT